MFKNKTEDNKNNICGKRIAELRLERKLSQRQLADAMELSNLSIDKNAIQRIECGKRFVTDIEIVYFSRYFDKPPTYLLGFDKEYTDYVTIAQKAAEKKNDDY